MTEAVDRPMLMAKKFGGLALVVLGMLAMAFGYQYGSGALSAIGVVAIILGAVLLALKVVRRNPD